VTEATDATCAGTNALLLGANPETAKGAAMRDINAIEELVKRILMNW